MKQQVKFWLNVFLLMLFVMMTIITCSGVWNAVYFKAIDSFYAYIAGINFIASGFISYKLGKQIANK